VGVNDKADPNSQVCRWDDHLTDAVAPHEIPFGDVVVVGGKIYVIHRDEVRSGGTSSWLAINPGNMDYTSQQETFGCYKGKKLTWGKPEKGKKRHQFAIFPDEATGMAAVRKFLRANQTTRTIRLMMKLFAPKTDGNKEDVYASRIVDALNARPDVTPKKVDIETRVMDLSDAQIEVYASTIRREEGFDDTQVPHQTFKHSDPTLPQEVQDRIAGKK
jgi:hypothetical protein